MSLQPRRAFLCLPTALRFVQFPPSSAHSSSILFSFPPFYHQHQLRCGSSQVAVAAALAGTRPLYRQQLPPTREELLQKMAPRGRNIKTEDSTNKNIRSFVPADLRDAFPEVASSPKIEELDISAVSVSLDGKHMNARKQTSNVVSNTNADPGSQQEGEGSTMSVGEQLAAHVLCTAWFGLQRASERNDGPG